MHRLPESLIVLSLGEWRTNEAYCVLQKFDKLRKYRVNRFLSNIHLFVLSLLTFNRYVRQD